MSKNHHLVSPNDLPGWLEGTIPHHLGSITRGQSAHPRAIEPSGEDMVQEAMHSAIKGDHLEGSVDQRGVKEFLQLPGSLLRDGAEADLHHFVVFGGVWGDHEEGGGESDWVDEGGGSS